MKQLHILLLFLIVLEDIDLVKRIFGIKSEVFPIPVVSIPLTATNSGSGL